MENKRLLGKAIMSIVLCALLLLMLTVSTLAWFSSTRRVQTNTVEGITAEEDLRLLISSQGGAQFDGGEEADIVQVNAYLKDRLLPVSTSDLESFVTCLSTNMDGNAAGFSVVHDEMYYYHGRVFLRAEHVGPNASGKVLLYFSEGAEDMLPIALPDSESLVMNAARLGLVFNDDPSTAKIFTVSELQNPEKERRINTLINGELISEGMVLDSSDGLRAVADPSEPIADYCISTDSASAPPKHIYALSTGEICQLDIYFYLEGCDADCTDSLILDGGFIQLGFFASTDGNGGA